MHRYVSPEQVRYVRVPQAVKSDARELGSGDGTKEVAREIGRVEDLAVPCGENQIVGIFAETELQP